MHEMPPSRRRLKLPLSECQRRHFTPDIVAAISPPRSVYWYMLISVYGISLARAATPSFYQRFASWARSPPSDSLPRFYFALATNAASSSSKYQPSSAYIASRTPSDWPMPRSRRQELRYDDEGDKMATAVACRGHAAGGVILPRRRLLRPRRHESDVVAGFIRRLRRRPRPARHHDSPGRLSRRLCRRHERLVLPPRPARRRAIGSPEAPRLGRCRCCRGFITTLRRCRDARHIRRRLDGDAAGHHEAGAIKMPAAHDDATG